MSYQTLEKLLGFKTGLPVSEKWSAAADFLTVISQYCLQYQPKNIVECSSGTSSLVLSRCCQLNNQGHVYSLENGIEFAEKSRQQLEDFALLPYCDVLHAPLENVQLEGVAYQWYSLAKLPEIEIDMLVIDGPPGFIQKHSRYPALPLLHDYLAEHCIIFLDDAGRDDEKEIVQRWLEFNPELSFEYIDNERGCSILRR